MTQFGPEIAVNGKRPDFVRDEDVCMVHWCNGRVSGAYPVGTVYKDVWHKVVALSLPATHPHYAKADEWVPDERTVREIAAYLEAEFPYSVSADHVRKTWGKPDPAEALVQRWFGHKSGHTLDVHGFAKWLIDQGIVAT